MYYIYRMLTEPLFNESKQQFRLQYPGTSCQWVWRQLGLCHDELYVIPHQGVGHTVQCLLKFLQYL